MDIKPIETFYNGYKFRSRLEARWALFFDVLGIEYEYEAEGLELSDGSKYLPDFYLVDFHCYFEVKRKGIKNTEEGKIAIKKIRDGSWTDSWAGIIAFGDPVDDDMIIFCQDVTDSSAGSYESKVTIGLFPNTSTPYLFSYDDNRDRYFLTSFSDYEEIPMYTTEYGKYEYSDFVNSKVYNARISARRARFEHGENPTKQFSNKLNDRKADGIDINRKVDWTDIISELIPIAPIAIQAILLDKNYLQGTVAGSVLHIQVLPGFYYDCVNRPRTLNLFADVASRVCGREMTVKLSELQPKDTATEKRNLEELRQFADVKFGT